MADAGPCARAWLRRRSRRNHWWCFEEGSQMRSHFRPPHQSSSHRHRSQRRRAESGWRHRHHLRHRRWLRPTAADPELLQQPGDAGQASKGMNQGRSTAVEDFTTGAGGDSFNCDDILLGQAGLKRHGHRVFPKADSSSRATTSLLRLFGPGTIKCPAMTWLLVVGAKGTRGRTSARADNPKDKNNWTMASC